MEHWSREPGLGLGLNVYFLVLALRCNRELFRSPPALVLLMKSTGSSPVHGFFPLGRPFPLGVSRLDGRGKLGGWRQGGR